jgi:hypothetical protein
MRKMLIYFVLSIVAMGFLGVVHGNDLNASDSQLMSAQGEWEVQSKKIYIQPHELSTFNNQIFAYLNGQWETVVGPYFDAEGLYVVARGYQPDCPPNFQKPVCPNYHPAVYRVCKPTGEYYRFLCNYHGCDYEYHNFVRRHLPPGYYLTGIER